MPGYAGEYRTIVDAKDGEILYCRQLVQTVAARETSSSETATARVR